VFDTGVRQFRLAMGMVWGRRLDPDNIERLVEDAIRTIAEFGEPGDDVQDLTDGPLTDPEAQFHFANTGLRRTAKRLSKQSPFYSRRFAAAEVDAAKLGVADLAKVPVTVKADLIRQPEDFLCADAPRHLATRTTGTTGRPAEIWLSRYETTMWPALGALIGVLRDDLRTTDVMQVNISSRATASVQLDVGSLRLAHCGARMLGLVPPDEALDSLTDGAVTLLSAVPSYLGELTVAARKRGLGPKDFSLRGISTGGEVLSAALAAAAAETFGVPMVNDLFGMTEVLPVSGRTCSQGHLHYDINTGHVEFLDLDTGEPAAPGALATVVITPYFPYRDCMPVFRYDTRDVIRRLPDEPLTCEVAGLPGVSKIVGKVDQLLRTGAEVVTPRQLVEAVEALPSEPWPARFRAVLDDSGKIVLTLPEHAIAGLGHVGAVAHFAERGLDVDLGLVPDDEAQSLRPLRCDLRETTFVARPALIGA
jgi:phenylacetate-coenzyme A ligase PaaK-like adenylate-forming protein